MNELEKAMARLTKAVMSLAQWRSVEVTAVSPKDREEAALVWKHAEWVLTQDVAEAAKAVERIERIKMYNASQDGKEAATLAWLRGEREEPEQEP